MNRELYPDNKNATAKTHRIKIWPEHFKAVRNGLKKAELRIFDREYEVGDTLVLNEWKIGTSRYTGNKITVRITHVLKFKRDGAMWAMLSIDLNYEPPQAAEGR